MTWMSLGWAHPIVMPSFQCHPTILVAFQHSKHSKQGGLTLASLRFQKVSPPIILCRGWWVDWLVPLNDIEWLEWFWNDGLKVEWCPLSFQGVASSQSTHHPLQRMMGGLTCFLNDIEWLEWLRNDGLKVEWCPRSFQGVASSQSPHHPLQRMMGGLTCRFEWYWMIRMISKWF